MDKVDSALLDFFTSANLGALREVALREVAGAVDEQDAPRGPTALGPRAVPAAAAADRRARHGPVRPERGAQRLVRGGWRTARRLGAELDVVSPEGRLDEAAGTAQAHRGARRDPGAHFIGVPAENLAGGPRAARRGPRSHASGHGRPEREGTNGPDAGDLLSSLLEQLEDVDIFLLADREESRNKEA